MQPHLILVPPPPVYRAWSSRRPHPVLLPLARRGLGAAASVLDPGTVSTIASTIQNVEGYYPGSIAYVNNNPGNLVYAGQAGAVASPGGYARFDTYQDGLNALYTQIQLYAGRGMTIAQMMNIYAPAEIPGNNPAGYAQTIAAALGVTPATSLADLSGLQSSAPSNAFTDVAVYDAGAGGLDPTALGLGLAFALVAWVLL